MKMKTKVYGALGMGLVVLGLAQYAYAAEFFRAGKIIRVNNSSAQFGGCMIQLDTSIGNGCPSTGYVSLDCNDDFYAAGEGKRKYATALTAVALDYRVTVKIDNAKKTADGFCTAERIDIFK